MYICIRCFFSVVVTSDMEMTCVVCRESNLSQAEDSSNGENSLPHGAELSSAEPLSGKA